MSVVQDVRSAVQDPIAPELREVRARLDALKERVDRLEQSLEHRFDKVDREADKRHQEMMFAVRSLIDYNNLNERLSQLEKERKSLHPSNQ